MAISATQPGLQPVSACPLCGSERYTTAFEEPPYAVRRCGKCGLGWVTPRRSQEDLVALYADDSYWRSQSPKEIGYYNYRSDEELYLKTFRRRLGFALRGGPRSGVALDVGCAAGFCMAVLRERGFEVHGVEVSETIARHAIDHFGFDTVHIGTLESAPYAERSFDLITMWDVVEHVVDPQALLQEARRLLKPGGLLVVETQDIDSRFARRLGPRWHHFKHHEHILHFTPATVRTLLEQAGFRVEKLTHRYGGKYVSTAFVAERAGRLAPLAKLESASAYLNFMDEMVVLSRPA